MKMKHDQVGNPYHIKENVHQIRETSEEKSLNHVYALLEQMLLELKAIHEHMESMNEKIE